MEQSLLQQAKSPKSSPAQLKLNFSISFIPHSCDTRNSTIDNLAFLDFTSHNLSKLHKYYVCVSGGGAFIRLTF